MSTKVAIGLVCLFFCAAWVQADEPYWAEPMRQVHASYTGGGGTISRMGDSISVSKAYFAPLQWGFTNTTPEDTAALNWIHGYVTSYCWTWQDNWAIHGCDGGTTAAWPLSSATGWGGALPGERKIDYWLRNDNPEMAVIMWGTNDLSGGVSKATYKSNLQEVILTCKANGTIPLITTICPRSGYDNGAGANLQRSIDYYDAAHELAVEQNIPLIEYHDESVNRRPHNPPTDTWDGTNAMWNAVGGYEVPTIISRDGVHPSNWSRGASNFGNEPYDWDPNDTDPDGLNTNGFNLRNWLTLHSCYDVWQEVINAPPWLPFEIKVDYAYLGNGKFGYTFKIDGRDGKQLSYFADVTFEGTNGGQIQQVKAFGAIDVDSSDTAALYDPIPEANYDMEQDSWFFEPFPGNQLVLEEGANSYHIEAGTGGGSHYEDMDLAYIVSTGDVRYSGQLARDAVNYDLDLTTITAPVPGDANFDDAVDGADYTLWADHYTQTNVGWVGGDFNGDGTVDGADYTIWADFYAPGGAPVPEPVTLILLGSGACVLLRRRRR